MKLDMTVRDPEHPDEHHFFVNILWERTVAIHIPAEDEKKWRPILELQLRNSRCQFQWSNAIVFSAITPVINLNQARVYLTLLIPSVTDVQLAS